MKLKARARIGISTTLLTAIIVVSFVAVVTVALVLSFIPGSGSACGSGVPPKYVCLTGLTLYGGDNSTLSATQGCLGFAELDVSGFNPSSNSVRITNLTLYNNSTGEFGSTLVSGSNSCLPFVYNSQPLAPNSDFDLEAFMNVTIGANSNWYALISFDNGQNVSQLLAAEYDYGA